MSITSVRPYRASPSNPFSTRFVRPGAIPFMFPPGVDSAQLAADFYRLGRRAEIVGPHGTGKSTLLASLTPELERLGGEPLLVTLRSGQHGLPPDFWKAQLRRQTIVVVDGYEQLRPWNRFRLRWLCWRLGCGLLITSHRPGGLPDLFRSDSTLETILHIADALQAAHRVQLGAAAVAGCLAEQGGNVREAFFSLYDLYEEQRATPPEHD